MSHAAKQTDEVNHARIERDKLDMANEPAKDGNSHRVYINLSTVLATIFGVVILAVGGRVFLNALDMREIKTLLTASIATQVEHRTSAAEKFSEIQSTMQREVDMMRKELERFETHINTMWYRTRRLEDKVGIEASSDEYQSQ